MRRQGQSPKKTLRKDLVGTIDRDYDVRVLIQLGATLDTSRAPLFANIVITGSDEDAAGHVSWVSKLHAQHAVVITINKHDLTLARARDKRTAQQQPLGRTLEQTLAPNATYVAARRPTSPPAAASWPNGGRRTSSCLPPRSAAMMPASASRSPAMHPTRKKISREVQLSTSVRNCRFATVSMARSTAGAVRNSSMVWSTRSTTRGR